MDGRQQTLGTFYEYTAAVASSSKPYFEKVFLLHSVNQDSSMLYSYFFLRTSDKTRGRQKSSDGISSFQ